MSGLLNCNRVRMMEDKNSLIKRINDSIDIEEVKRLTLKSERIHDGVTRNEVRIAGVTRWGTLTELEGRVIGCEVRDHYAFDVLISEFAIPPKDGLFRTREDIGCYAGKVEVMGESHGYYEGFKVVYKMGVELYGKDFTPEIAEHAFVSACQEKPFCFDKVKEWYEELSEKEPEKVKEK